MSEFVKAVEASALAPGQAMELTVGGKAVALFNVNGTFYATSNTCIHRGGPLGQGFLEGQNVTCPWHSWQYDVTTGENVVNREMKVASYPVKVEDGLVLVNVE